MTNSHKYLNPKYTTKERVADLRSKMSLSQKVGQMIQAEWTQLTPTEMATYELGALLSGGQAMAEVLVGNKKFSGKLPMPWYQTVADIEKDIPNLLFEAGFGLNY